MRFNPIKKFLYQSLTLENYLRVLQRSYFWAYQTGILKRSSDYAYHYFVKQLIREGDVVLDIGANLGYYSILFAQWVGSAGEVHAVEPIRIYNKIFNEKAKKYTNISLYPYALGIEEKTVDLVSSPAGGYLNTGLPHVYNSETDGTIENQSFRFESQMKIPSLLFKDLKKIDYIKCDIEGFEYLVLSDMKELIRKFKPKVQVELWSDNEEQTLQLFNELGYLPYKLHKNRLILQNGTARRIEGDYIFLPETS
ncbi:MAG: FkbM family methyltransferase [Dysgonamonadaceae bacterium]|jgi:FkbM family methyltransferase|nr:FkbM family methyltransferase [Dysgonamonadaceae bacterium]